MLQTEVDEEQVNKESERWKDARYTLAMKKREDGFTEITVRRLVHSAKKRCRAGMRHHMLKELRNDRRIAELVEAGRRQYAKDFPRDPSSKTLDHLEDDGGFIKAETPQKFADMEAVDTDGGFRRAKKLEGIVARREQVRSENKKLFKSFGPGAWRCRDCGKIHKASVVTCDGFRMVGSKEKKCIGTLMTAFGGFITVPPLPKDDDGSSPWQHAPRRRARIQQRRLEAIEENETETDAAREDAREHRLKVEHAQEVRKFKQFENRLDKVKAEPYEQTASWECPRCNHDAPRDPPVVDILNAAGRERCHRCGLWKHEIPADIKLCPFRWICTNSDSSLERDDKKSCRWYDRKLDKLPSRTMSNLHTVSPDCGERFN